MAKSGRRKVITPEIGKTIVVIMDRHAGWSLRDIQNKIPAFYREVNGKSLPCKIPSLNPINDFIEETVKPKREAISESGIDKPWTSAALINEPMGSETIHWLICLQVYKRLCFSKPFTIREAKWFRNLLNFRENYSCPWEINLTPEYEDIFLSHAIATWAQIYAYREKIDNIAGIKDADYGDLDTGIATADFSKLIASNDYSENWASTLNHSKKYLMPHLVDSMRLIEFFFIAHSLGYPDMADSSIILYAKGLLLTQEDNTNKPRIEKLSYIQRVRLLVLLREWAKGHPDASEEMVKPMVEQMFNKVENEGMEWEDHNWQVLKIPQN
jgi:hypothetical protein